MCTFSLHSSLVPKKNMILKMGLMNVTLLGLVIFLVLDRSNTQFLVPTETGDIFEKYTFKDKEYTLYSKKVSWTEASYICQLHNETLAVLDDVEQAIFVAEALANTEMSVKNIWIGAKKDENSIKWTNEKELLKTTENVWDPNEPDESVKYPAWLKSDKERNDFKCIGLYRGNHNKPVLIDMKCNTKRSFVCEKSALEIESSNRGDLLTCDDNQFRIFDLKLKWEDAAGYCALHDMSLASIDDEECMEKIGVDMLRRRPSIENAWVGAKEDEGTWSWIKSGLEINQTFILSSLLKSFIRNEHKGCLLLDKHGARKPKFVEAKCERKRRFICMITKIDSNEKETKVEGRSGKINYFQDKMTWQMAKESCDKLNGHLSRINSRANIQKTLSVMSNFADETLNHLWVSGKVNSSSKDKDTRWYDPVNNVYINISEIQDQDITCYDYNSTLENMCLNFDRKDNHQVLLYPLQCETLQRSLCTIGDSENMRALSADTNESSPKDIDSYEEYDDDYIFSKLNSKPAPINATKKEDSVIDKSKSTTNETTTIKTELKNQTDIKTSSEMDNIGNAKNSSSN